MEIRANHTLDLMNRELHVINRALRHTLMLTGLVVVSGLGVGIWMVLTL